MSELPKGWAKANLQELSGIGGVVTDGDWIETKDQDSSGSVRLIQLMDIGDGEFRDRSERFLTQETATRLNCTFLKENDLLIARMPDPLGRACLFPGVGQEAVTAVDILVWRTGDEGAEPRWLMHVINSPYVRDQIASQAGGTTRQRISGRRLKDLSVPVPPVAEQKRIVAKLDRLFAQTKTSRGELDRIPMLIEHYKQAILVKAFSGELTAAERERSTWAPAEYRASGIDGRSEDLIAAPPVGWCWTSMDQISEVTGGLTKNPKRAHNDMKVPYLRVANVYANELRLDEVKEIGCSPAELAKTSLQKDDLLIVEGNGSLEQIGRVAIWEGSLFPCSHQNHLIRARANGSVPARYILYWLLSPVGRQAIERVASSSAGLHTLSITKVSGIPIPVTAYEEASEVVRKIESAFAWIDTVSGETNKAASLLEHLDGGVLSKAFHGELVPQDPHDEPAEKLLERIRAMIADRSEVHRKRRARR